MINFRKDFQMVASVDTCTFNKRTLYKDILKLLILHLPYTCQRKSIFCTYSEKCKTKCLNSFRSELFEFAVQQIPFFDKGRNNISSIWNMWNIFLAYIFNTFPPNIKSSKKVWKLKFHWLHLSLSWNDYRFV